MAPNSFNVYFPSPPSISGDLVAVNTGGSNLSFQVSGASPKVNLAPYEVIKFMIAPTGVILTDTQASGILAGQVSNNNTSGQFFSILENPTTNAATLPFPLIEFPNSWENTAYNLYWLQKIKGESFGSFGASRGGVYSFPHNIQSNEILVSGTVSSDVRTIDYKVLFTALNGEADVGYSGGTDLPYKLLVEYTYPDEVITPASGFSTGYQYFAAGSSLSGISFSLPFYDHRGAFDLLPANYTFSINYNSVGAVQPGSTPAKIVVDHALIKDNLLIDLSAQAAANITKEDLSSADPIVIPEDIITRKRLAIGIEDIKSIERSFVKKGTFISNSYNLDFNIYTFSLKSDEFIPEYPNINKFDTIKYYVDFNNTEWLRISPLDREGEIENEIIIPKLFVFDKTSNESSESSVKFLNKTGSINNFRIKIIMDLTTLLDATFVPPEVRSYKCLIFDKERFINIEE